MLGIHITKTSPVFGKSPDILRAIERHTSDLEINACQIFTHGPRSFMRSVIDYTEVRKYCRKNKILLIVHCSYMLPSIWNYKEKPLAYREKIEAHFIDQIETCKILGAPLVLHLPKFDKGHMIFIIQLLRHLMTGIRVKILFEIIATKPNEHTFENTENLNQLCEDLSTLKTPWGLCLDTAHLWSSGVNLQDYKETKEWFKAFKYRKRISLFHFNGEKHLIQSGKDTHAIAFTKADKIWGNISYNNSGAKFILQYAKKNDIPVICEINDGSIANARKSLSFIKSRLMK